MGIKTRVTTIFVTADGIEHLTEKAAQEHWRAVVRDGARGWLAEALEEAGGVHYDFDILTAAEWVLDNYESIGEKMRADGTLYTNPFAVESTESGD